MPCVCVHPQLCAHLLQGFASFNALQRSFQALGFLNNGDGIVHRGTSCDHELLEVLQSTRLA